MNSIQNLKSQQISTPKIDISFKDIVYQVQARQQTGSKSKKTILNGISGIFKAGQLSAIMGSSGAGKTTLLNILTGRISNFKGQVLANNTPYSFQNFGDFANYVMQGDILMQTLTVRQTLQFAAHLKIFSESEVQQTVKDLAYRMKLDKCLDVVVGGPMIKGVSGGQKKRTSIALELLTNPQVIILDEPTSGMDSLTSFIIINNLKTLAKQGKTIFLTIHQPNSDIFNLFDNLVLMVEGQIIYQGHPLEAQAYFSNNFGLHCPEFANRADYYMSLMHQEQKENVQRYPLYYKAYEQNIAQVVNSNIENRCTQGIQPRKSQINFIKILIVLLGRDLKNILRNPMVMKSRIVQVIFVSIYTGGLYFNAGRKDYMDVINWNAITGYLFFISMDLFMQSLMPTTLTFPLERLVFLKEENSKMYTLVPYFISRNILQIPYIVIIPLIFVVINYWMIGLANTAEQFFIMYLLIFLMTFTATSAGMFVGSLVQNPHVASNFITMLALPLITFSGFFKNNGNFPDWIGWIKQISPFHYSFISLVINQTKYKASPVNQLNFEMSMWAAAGVQVGLGIGFRILSFLTLWLKKDKLQ